ncbi:MAG TPA: TIGR00282 family metallophosphoesterase [bacterium]|nr:TIGR00282 family metallophosphoesterase [bacterium]
MNILVIGDIIGKPGRRAIADLLPKLKRKHRIDMVIVNGENAAGGIGITSQITQELHLLGIDVITSGNHVWKHKEIYGTLNKDPYLLRPANYPPLVPGKGSCIFSVGKEDKVGVLNLMGRVFLAELDCPFRKADEEIEKLSRKTKIIIVDIHGEITSEKTAIGWYLDGRVSAVVGTHTHIPTADERVLPKGTAYITDLGMVGSLNSVIGIKTEIALKRFLTQIPIRFEVEKKNIYLQGVVITIDNKTGKAKNIERIQEKVRK